jgi:hypothetical protein
MSYLSGPRLVFAGQFQADVSTVNNDPEHFDNATFTPADQVPGAGGWWNPGGTGAWRLIGCVVTSVVYADGSTTDDPSVDPIVGASIASVNQPSREAKLVDLDSEQQMVSEIWGLKVNLVATGMGFTSNFAVSPFQDIYSPSYLGGADSYFGAAYQSVLQNIQWTGAGSSKFLQELSAAGAPTQLSLKFNVSGFNDSASPITFPDGSPPLNFTFGRLVGSIGPSVAGEPLSFVAGRSLAFSSDVLNTLQSQNTSSPVLPSTAYAAISGGVLHLDLGNALYTTSTAGPLVDFGPMEVALASSDGSTQTLGTIPYMAAGWLSKTAGIASLPLTSAQAQASTALPLVVLAGGKPLLSEALDGVFVRADAYVFRLDPAGPPASTTFTLLKYGVPVAGQPISIALDAAFSGGQPPIGTPTTALTFDSSLTTGSDGTAMLAITPSDPGNPRGFIDGQVYSLLYGPGTTPPPAGSVGNPSRCLNVLVWSAYTAPSTPTWANDVGPIFQQYANLYPVMKPIVDLSSQADVIAKATRIEYVFNLDPTDPLSMPVTRDLSPTRRAMLLQWLASPDHP